MSHLGDYAEDFADLNFKFNTRQFSTGAPFALAGTPVISVYKSNDATQSTAGVTLTNPFDSVVGLMHVKIDLSSDAFYAVNEDYQVVLTAGTVDSVSVIGAVVAEFSIENRFMRGTDSALLAASAPTNFSALGIESDGDITKVNLVASNTDMRGTDGVDTATMRGTDGVDTATMRGTDGANTDKTGYSLSTAGILAIWNQLTSALTTASTIGKLLVDNINATISSRATQTSVNALEADSIAKNAAYSNFEFLMVLTSDHVTPATGLTVTGERSIDGGAFGAVSGTIAEISNGIYQFDALAADTNGDVITWRFFSATADDTFVTFNTST